MSCTPQLRKQELRWGFLTSLFSGGINTGALFYASNRGWDPKTTFPLIMFTVGLIGHAMDIIIAKRCFHSWSNSNVVEKYGYSPPDLRKRVLWYGKSLISMSFVRHLMVALLDALVVGKLTEIASKKLDGRVKTEKRVSNKWRDPLIATFIGLITFNLYVNVLRFSWVYQTDPDILVTVAVSMWLVFVMYYQLDT